MKFNLSNFVNYFVFLYPAFMSIVWIIGGLIFYIRRERKRHLPALENYPFISVIVPAHNEEEWIEKTISHLNDIDYPNYEVIAVNDGSTDRTPQILEGLLNKFPWLRVIHLKPNVGKSTALNAGILASKGEFLVTIDADAFLTPEALKWFMWHFMSYPRVGAVTGNPRVANRTTLLGKIQVGEYASIIGLIKRSQRILGKVLTVSGVVAAFRKKALLDAGFFSPKMSTEDIDITWELEKRFWDIRYEPQAVCWVLVPETLKGLWRQRFRWAQGGVEVLKKHINIWKDWKQRRLWPVYVEYVISAVWSYSFIILVLLWAIRINIEFFTGEQIFSFISIDPLIPRWNGAILAFCSLIQFLVSIFIDRKYEKKVLIYYFWIVWYPFFYWIIGALAMVAAMPKAIFKKQPARVTWESPDRGI